MIVAHTLPTWLWHVFHWPVDSGPNGGYGFFSGVGSGSPIFIGLLLLYRRLQCHKTGCHRLGRFSHGHLHLCHKHHPKVPDHGKVSDYQISQVKEP